MNAEELKFYTALQSFFKEKMGPWQVGDRYYNVYKEETMIVENYRHASDFNHFGNIEDTLRLPAALDSNGPDESPSERCLWGMVDWLRKRGVWEFSVMGTIIINYPDGHRKSFPPTLALLKAIAAQEEVTP